VYSQAIETLPIFCPSRALWKTSDAFLTTFSSRKSGAPASWVLSPAYQSKGCSWPFSQRNERGRCLSMKIASPYVR
jgi:hypothetical protein